MKQKEVIFYEELSLEAKELAREYFAVRRVNGIEGFILSEEEFIDRYKGTNAYKELKSKYYHPVYTIDECDSCAKPFDIDVESRDDLNRQIKNPPKLCLGCRNMSFSLGQIIAIGLGKDVF
ncbi:hypothetical protein [Gelidibacter mesophilus]|uniref:hypothetical protein n=1 Tax=Gelidibacter mesophilus TaxID=169050 RepID=UPI000485479F|nr:hypothetical protein [Gelidibacter mesophilus]